MEIVNILKQILPSDRVTTNKTILEHHGIDESYQNMALPDVVVFPIDTDEVSQIIKLAQTYQTPVVPFALGTSLEGHVIPYYGGISIDFTLMNKVLEIRQDDFLVKVQPGVTRSQLNNELKKHGLFFPIDPGADATLGGMTATNASGTTSVRYGIMRDQVRDIEVVLADGSIIYTGGMSAKSSSGYHLNGLFVGSEGTLGCFTEITLRVYGIPEKIMAARATFPTIEKAVDAVFLILKAGIPIARCELVDEVSIRQVNQFSKTNYKEAPSLFLEFHGNEAGLNQDVKFTKEIVYDEGCDLIEIETDSKSRKILWEARHNLAYAFIHGFPQKKLMVTDVCVPITQLTAAIKDTRYVIDQNNLNGAVLGHVGDGNYHGLLMVNVNDKEEMMRAQRVNDHIVEYALSKGGTCTGEHGVGIGKKKYQEREHGEAYKVMLAIKQTFDPNFILNPGKIFNKN